MGESSPPSTADRSATAIEWTRVPTPRKDAVPGAVTAGSSGAPSRRPAAVSAAVRPATRDGRDSRNGLLHRQVSGRAITDADGAAGDAGQDVRHGVDHERGPRIVVRGRTKRARGWRCPRDTVCAKSNGPRRWRSAAARDRVCGLLRDVERHKFRSHAEARMAVFEFIEGWYNPRPRHSAIGYLSPVRAGRRRRRPSTGRIWTTPARSPAAASIPTTCGQSTACWNA